MVLFQKSNKFKPQITNKLQSSKFQTRDIIINMLFIFFIAYFASTIQVTNHAVLNAIILNITSCINLHI